jgi:hypothetical protein
MAHPWICGLTASTTTLLSTADLAGFQVGG